MTLADFAAMMLDLYSQQGIPMTTFDQLYLDWQEYEMDKEQIQKRHSQ